ncbi:MAG: hypothetical protein JO185_06610 [Acidobacteriaceae bacterium]|nr:hypothetical protein [Acidobacteriaceae bacterium]
MKKTSKWDSQSACAHTYFSSSQIAHLNVFGYGLDATLETMIQICSKQEKSG